MKKIKRHFKAAHLFLSTQRTLLSEMKKYRIKPEQMQIGYRIFTKSMMSYLLYLTFFLFFSLHATECTEQKLNLLYSSLDPTSIKQHLAFYELYPHQPLGRQALKDAWKILARETGSVTAKSEHLIPFSTSVIKALISLVNKQTNKESPLLQEEDLLEIEKLSAFLKHKKLKGHYASSEREVLLLPFEEVDLAHGLFITEMGSDSQRMRSYEALLDIMALQIYARLPKCASPKQIIYEINQLIFDEMGFRFPPKSVFKENIDIYTFLPSVLDSHEGVCLGVSIVYVCLAQRLGLKMEIITPPGHIYVRYRDSNEVINIETTARGIHLDSEEYLSIDTCDLQQRNVKEVIGLAHFNQAAVFWQQKDYEGARQAYLRAQPYLENDFLLKEFMGYTSLLTGRKEEGELLLNEVKDHIPDHSITNSTLANDYLQGNVDIESIKIIFSKTEDGRSSILTQKAALEEILKTHPRFRSGLIQLGMTWIKLHRYTEALEVFKNYYTIDPHEPDVNYYLAILSLSRMDYSRAWLHLQETEKIVHTKNHYPKILKDLRSELLKKSPEYKNENLHSYRR